MVLTQPKPWTLGALFRQLWSFAGDDDRSDVNQFLFEPFINYNLSKGWCLISDMVVTANWDADSGQRWTVGGSSSPTQISARLTALMEAPLPATASAIVSFAQLQKGESWSKA